MPEFISKSARAVLDSGREISMSSVLRDIPGYPGYMISERGEIVSYRRKNPRVLKTRVNNSGNEQVRLTGPDGKQRAHGVGNLVLRAWVGPPPPGQECRHGPRGRRCHELSNLCWGTKVENEADKVRDGTDSRGEKNGRSKLTEQDVLDVRASGMTQQQLADKYGVSQKQISFIINRKLWSHV
jgi:predicted XRE-type DNA-binding protein